MISDGKTIYFDAVEAGDEPFWLSQNTPGCYVFTCKTDITRQKYAVNKFGIQYIIFR